MIEKNPYIKIDTEYASWDDYWKKLASMETTNSLPDIIQMDLAYLSQYAQNNQITDLTPFLNKEIDVMEYDENYINGRRLDDKLYALNAGVNAFGFHYDPELLKNVDVDSIPNDWTWNNYEKIAAKVKEAGLLMDNGLGVATDWKFNYFLRTKGQLLYFQDGTSLGYDADQLFVEFFTGINNI